MSLGMPLAEYERNVGPLNRHFHESAEYVKLHKDGTLPLDPDGEGPKETAKDLDSQSDIERRV